MSLKEELQVERDNFWNEMINTSLEHIKKCCKIYLEENEYAEDKLVISLFAKNLNRIVIEVNINGMVPYTDEYMVTFQKDITVNTYLQRLAIVIQTIGIQAIDWDKAFSSDKVGKGEKCEIFKGVIMLL